MIRKLSSENGVTILISSHILSEVEQMADKVGIIDHGILLEELTMDELRYKNRHFVKLTVSDISRAIPVMEKELAISDYEILNDHDTLPPQDRGRDKKRAVLSICPRRIRQLFRVHMGLF